MKLKFLCCSGVAAAVTLAAILGLINYTIGNEASGQKMMSFAERDQNGNNTFSSQLLSINGTINLDETIFKAIGSKVNTSLTKAINTAEQTIGNKSFALAAFGGPYGHYLVYTVILATPGMEFHKVIIDPGTGKILGSQRLSQEDFHMFMHGGGHSGEGMMMGNELPMKPDSTWK